MRMKKLFWLYLILMGVGLVVLSWPEENNVMLVKLSETHGPSVLDSIGLLMIATGYGPIVLMVVKRFNYIRSQRGKSKPFVLAIISLVALVTIGVALNMSNEIMLWISVAVSTTCQSILVYDAFLWDKSR
jgi:hypothetical protein